MYKAGRDRIRRTGWMSVVRDAPILCQQAINCYLAIQRAETPQWIDSGFVAEPVLDPYQAWLAANAWTTAARETLVGRLRTCSGTLPKISVVMPVYDPPVQFLEAAIRSVAEQVYENWELCIADDKSRDPKVRMALERWAARDPRIKVVFREANGHISRATNSAAEAASGEFLCFLDHDDELTPDALGEAALYIAEHPETDFVYSDDDKIDEHGRRFAPQFKPDWSPELLLSYMYLCHIGLIRRELFQKLEGDRPGFEGAQDYDLALRATERARHVGHIPLVLYHWRAIAGSTATTGSAKPEGFEAGRRAVQEAIQRRGGKAIVVQPEWALKARVGIFAHEFPDEGPRVAIIIPTRNRLKTLRTCLDSLAKTTYRNYEVVIVDNESDEPATLAYLQRLPHRVLRLKSPGGRFSFAYLNNEAARQADAEYVLMLNNDTQVIEPRWLSRMMGYAQLPGVGAVGAKLTYPDGRIQHAGILHGLHHGLAEHAFKLMDRHEQGYLSYAMVARNYVAMTAACLLTPRKLLLEMGGLDEKLFAVAYNDVDYGLRLQDRGYRCVYCPGAELIHHEGLTRGFCDDPREAAAYRRRYGQRSDRFYSPHLSLADERFHIQPRRLVRGQPRGIRAMLISQGLDFTGAPLIQHELAMQLRAHHGIEPVVFSIADGPLRGVYEQHGIQVIVQDHPLAAVLAGKQTYEEAISGVAQLMREVSADVVYANTLNSFFGVAAAEQAGIGSIWNIHESEGWERYFDNLGPEMADQALGCFRWPYRVIFGSDATRHVYEAMNTRHNFTAIHNALDEQKMARDIAEWPRALARQSLGVGEDEIVLLLLGTICERKGQLDLPLALARLGEPWAERVRCFIVGDRPSDYSSQVHAAVTRLPEDLRRRVAVVAETGQTARYYAAADISLCTSRMECFPRVILEAMTFGLPIITTSVFGIREQVQNGVNGLTYEPGNVAHLAEAITRLLSDSRLRRVMAENAPYVLQRLHNASEVAAQYAQILYEAAAAKGRIG